jgi:hypothetical protein
VKPLYPDTAPAAEQAQIELMRRMSPAQRVAIARSLGARAISLMRRAIRRRYPDATEEEVKLKFIELQYGTELAERVRAYWRDRRT